MLLPGRSQGHARHRQARGDTDRRQRSASATRSSEDPATVTDEATASIRPPTPRASPATSTSAMRRTATDATEDLSLWVVIRKSTEALSFNNYFRFMNFVLCGEPIGGEHHGIGVRIEAPAEKIRAAEQGTVPAVQQLRGLSPPEGGDRSLRDGELWRRAQELPVRPARPRPSRPSRRHAGRSARPVAQVPARRERNAERHPAVPRPDPRQDAGRAAQELDVRRTSRTICPRTASASCATSSPIPA